MQPPPEIDRSRVTEPTDLAQQSEQLRTAHREPEHHTHHGVDTIESGPRAAERRVERKVQLLGTPRDGCVEQGLLRGVPIQHGLFAHTERGCDGVERGRLIATSAELGQGLVEDAVTGARHGVSVAGMDSLSTIW